MAKPQYGRAHQLEREKWKRVVQAGLAYCCLCGKWLHPDAPFDLDHMPGTDLYRGVACRRCNRSEGAARGNRGRGRSWTL